LLLFCIEKREKMDNIFELIKYVVPLAIVLVIGWYLMKALAENSNNNRDLILRFFAEHNKKDNPVENGNSDFTRLQLQAYERMTLFLERINPNNLIPRVLPGNNTVLQFQRALLQSIREEWEHNLSQQIYINEKVWDFIKAAKENTVQLINAAAKEFANDDNAALLANKLLTRGFGTENNPVEKAVAAIKSEIAKKYNV